MPKKRRSAQGASRNDTCLIVDGYNIVGGIAELSELAKRDFDAARDLLIDWLAEYGGKTNQQVIAVFDAHLKPGSGFRYDSSKVDVRFTRQNETADELIERLVASFRDENTFALSTISQSVTPRKIIVATSDQLQQRLVFGYGALRMPVSELYALLRSTKQDTRKSIRDRSDHRTRMDERIREEIREKLDQMRKGKI